MTLAAQVLDHLRGRGIDGAIIGGVAMAVHGIARATVDLDLLVTDSQVLAGTFWLPLGGHVDIRKGDAGDPLAGVVRCLSGGAVVDVVVGGTGWMRDAVARATPHDLAGELLPVVDAADLVLLKLYAGGPQDLLDARLLLGADPGLREVVRSRMAALPAEARDRLPG